MASVTERPRRVALFGGSFSPPHVAHQLVALYVLETQPIDEIWFVPVFTHVFGKDLAPFEDRVRMCELALEPLGPRAKLCRAEEELAGRPGFQGSRTLDLIEHLQATEPHVTWRLLVGTDILGETEKWHRWEEVVKRAPLIAIGRTGYVLPDGSSATGVTMPSISSTDVRARLAALPPGALAVAAGLAPADDVDDAARTLAAELASLLPRSVLRYIAERGLYPPRPHA